MYCRLKRICLTSLHRNLLQSFFREGSSHWKTTTHNSDIRKPYWTIPKPEREGGESTVIFQWGVKFCKREIHVTTAISVWSSLCAQSAVAAQSIQRVVANFCLAGAVWITFRSNIYFPNTPHFVVWICKGTIIVEHIRKYSFATQRARSLYDY